MPAEVAREKISAVAGWTRLGKRALIYIFGTVMHGISSSVFGFYRGIREPGVPAPSVSKLIAKSERAVAKAEERLAKAKAKAEVSREISLAKAKGKAGICGPPPKAGIKPRCTAGGYSEPEGGKAGPLLLPDVKARMAAASRMMTIAVAGAMADGEPTLIGRGYTSGICTRSDSRGIDGESACEPDSVPVLLAADADAKPSQKWAGQFELERRSARGVQHGIGRSGSVPSMQQSDLLGYRGPTLVHKL